MRIIITLLRSENIDDEIIKISTTLKVVLIFIIYDVENNCICQVFKNQKSIVFFTIKYKNYI